MEGRNRLLLSVEKVPDTEAPRCVLFKLGFQPMQMASLGIQLSFVTTLIVALMGLLIYGLMFFSNPISDLTIPLSVFIICVSVYGIKLRRTIVQETLLINHDLGVQIETVFLDGKRKYRFLDKHTIVDVVLNEAFSGCQVVTYLSFMVEGQDALVVAFRNFPGNDVLQHVYRGTCKTLQI